jgi:hypothetical protein
MPAGLVNAVEASAARAGQPAEPVLVLGALIS